MRAGHAGRCRRAQASTEYAKGSLCGPPFSLEVGNDFRRRFLCRAAWKGTGFTACRPPQRGHAIAAAMTQAKLRGFIVDQQAVAIEFSLHASRGELRDRIFSGLAENIGTRKAKLLIE
jgi:hypothetical protein